MDAEDTESGACTNVCHTKKNDISRPHFCGPYASLRKTYVPPALGIAAPSSDHTNASKVASSAPPSHASKHCGPPICRITMALTTNGPMPTISIMLSATASFSPRPRSSPSPAGTGKDAGSAVVRTPPASLLTSSRKFIGPPRIANAPQTSYSAPDPFPLHFLDAFTNASQRPHPPCATLPPCLRIVDSPQGFRGSCSDGAAAPLHIFSGEFAEHVAQSGRVNRWRGSSRPLLCAAPRRSRNELSNCRSLQRRRRPRANRQRRRLLAGSRLPS